MRFAAANVRELIFLKIAMEQKAVEYGLKGRIVVASRAFVYTNAILRCKMLVGLCPIPFILHRSDAGCAFFQNASIYIR